MSGEARSLKVALNARAAAIRNIVGVLVSLAAVPLALRGLGTEGYGTYQVLVSLGNLAASTDAGLGLALLTRVGQLSGAGQHAQIRHTVGGALMVISVVVVLLASLALGALLLMDLSALLKIPPALRAQTRNGLFIVLAAFVVRMPLSVFSSAHAGLQLGDRLFAWNILGSTIASMAMATVAVVTRRLDLTIGCQLALSQAAAIGAARLGCHLEPSTLPIFDRRDLKAGWSLLRSGFFYYLLQLEVTIIGGIDNLVIAKVVGVSGVALYSVASRMISLAFSMVYSLGASFWGGVSQAFGKGDIAWIASEATRLRRLGALWMAIFSGGFAAVGVPAIALWTGGRLHVDPLLPAVLGTYFALLGHTMIDSSILNGAERIRQQVVTVGLDAGLNLALSIWLAHRIGYVGVAVGTLVAYSTCTFLPMQIFSWRLVVRGPRPPFWTRSLSTMVLAVCGGFLINRVLSGPLRLGPLAATAVGGTASLLLTLALIRAIPGREALEALKSSLRRSKPAVTPPPRSQPA